MCRTSKAKVIAAFNDRENPAETYQVGDTFEGTEERINELVYGGYLAPVEEKTQKQEPKKER